MVFIIMEKDALSPSRRAKLTPPARRAGRRARIPPAAHGPQACYQPTVQPEGPAPLEKRGPGGRKLLPPGVLSPLSFQERGPSAGQAPSRSRVLRRPSPARRAGPLRRAAQPPTVQCAPTPRTGPGAAPKPKGQAPHVAGPRPPPVPGPKGRPPSRRTRHPRRRLRPQLPRKDVFPWQNSPP